MAEEFLQSIDWKKFQESVRRKTFILQSADFSALIIEHPVAFIGRYFYIPRGPIIKKQALENSQQELKKNLQELITLAKKENVGWIRIEPKDSKILDLIKKNTEYEIKKASCDIQPKEIFMIDIAKSEGELLTEMKSKTRYNIKLAQKKGVQIRIQKTREAVEDFLRLIKIMAKRQKIKTHPENYYRKMLETISDDNLKLYLAEYAGEVIAANLVIFYGEICIYLHGASDDKHRSLMAPYLLQWTQIRDAKKNGCRQYDFGGVANSKWQGITKFKLGFSPKTKAIVYPGSYDLIINSKKYWLYRTLQKIKTIGK